MANRAHITYKADPKTLKKHLKPAAKEALKEIADEWHSDTFPKHFTEAGRRKYQYRARTKKYRKNKRRRLGHNRPLVNTGDLRRKATRRARITGTAKRATASMSGLPWYATRHFHGQKKTYADEMTTVTKSEAKQMAQSLKEKMEESLSDPKKQKRARK